MRYRYSRQYPHFAGDEALGSHRPNSELLVNPAAAATKLPRKGMTAAELEELLGEPIQTAERSEGSLRVVTRTYPFGDGRLVAEFVEDTLFRYSMTSE